MKTSKVPSTLGIQKIYTDPPHRLNIDSNRQQVHHNQINRNRNRSMDRFQLPQIGIRPTQQSPNKVENENQMPKINNNLSKFRSESPKSKTPLMIGQIKVDRSQFNSINLSIQGPAFKENRDQIKMSQKNFFVQCSRTKAGLSNPRQVKINQDTVMVDPEILHNITVLNKGCLDGVRAYGVFDGHGVNGHIVSQFIRNTLPNYLEQFLSKLKGSMDSNPIHDAIFEAYRQTNKDLCAADTDTNLSGSTVVSVIFYGNKLFCANTGDSRAIMSRIGPNGKPNVISLSVDHKPDLPRERERIIRAGGRVDCQRNQYGQQVGPYRVWLAKIDVPGLAMTRSFGDKVGIQAGVIGDPEILEFELTPQDQFIVIASDGVWEYLSDSDVIKMVHPYYLSWNIDNAADTIMSRSLQEWKRIYFGRDDISCIVLFLNHRVN